jgi:hypothetical protein
MSLALLLTVALAVPQEKPQDKPKVPKDSIELVVTGCLTGRVLSVDDVREVDVQSGPIVRSKSFRIAGKKDVIEVVKQENHHLVEVTGLVKRSALIEPGVKIGNRVTVGGGPPVAGGGGGMAPSPGEYIPVLDATSVRFKASSCGGGL